MGLGRLWRLLRASPGSAGRGSAAASTPGKPAVPAPVRVAPAAEAPAAEDASFSPSPEAAQAQARESLAWLLALPAGGPPATGRVESLLAAVDAALAREAAAGRLLRRAPNLVPRLVNALRNDAWDRREVVAQIQRDAVLTAETLRLARSALYARQGEGGGVAQAVDLLGATGLKQVIARVLVRPLFQSDGDSPAARAAPRIWEESDRCARLCVALAREMGSDTVDACLAGLLHNVGWSVLLQLVPPGSATLALDRGLLQAPGAAQALALRRDRILALLLPGWGLSPLLTAWGESLRAGPAAAPTAGTAGTVQATALSALQAQLAQAECLVARRRCQLLAGEPPEPPPGLAPAVAQVFMED